MLPRQVLTVAIRLFALCFGISALRLLPNLLIVGEDASRGHTYGFFFVTLNVTISILLWLFPGLVAGKLISERHEQSIPASADTWLAIGCALIGLWMLTYAVPALIRDAYLLWSLTSEYSDASTTKSWVLYNLLEVAIALWLVFGATGFRRLFWWARGAGLARPTGE